MLRRLTDPEDPDLQAAAALLAAVFPDPNTVLGLDRLQEFLREPSDDRQFNVLAAKSAHVVVGCTVFSYVAASNCGFSEYIATSKVVRGGGLGRMLFEARRDLLDQQARAAGHNACHGLFIEADNPDRVPAALREQERVTALDTEERLDVFAHFGFKRVDVAYVQPPLATGKEPVTYLDLLFAPWTGETERIDAQWVVRTLEPIWRAWSPDTYLTELDALRAQLTQRLVALKPLHSQLETS